MIYYSNEVIVSWDNRIINIQVKDKTKHTIKYYSFLNRDSDLPFMMKRRVAEACLMSSLLYGSETWICEAYSNLERACRHCYMYMSQLVMMLVS